MRKTRARLTLRQRQTMGRKIRRHREAQGWNQRILARKIRVSQPCISHWEKGENTPSPTNTRKLERVLDAELEAC